MKEATQREINYLCSKQILEKIHDMIDYIYYIKMFSIILTCSLLITQSLWITHYWFIKSTFSPLISTLLWFDVLVRHLDLLRHMWPGIYCGYPFCIKQKLMVFPVCHIIASELIFVLLFQTKYNLIYHINHLNSLVINKKIKKRKR